MPVAGSLTKRSLFQTRTPGIELIVDDAGTARNMTSNGSVAPGSAERARNALPVQIDRNGLRALAGGKGTEDATDDGGFIRHDLAVAPDRLSPPASSFLTTR